MLKLVLKFLVIAAAVYGIATYVDGISVDTTQTILIVAAVWSVIILLIRPVLRVLTFPLTLLTLGLFSFVLNAALFFGMTYLVPGFSVDGIMSAVIGSFILSAVSYVADHLLG